MFSGESGSQELVKELSELQIMQDQLMIITNQTAKNNKDKVAALKVVISALQKLREDIPRIGITSDEYNKRKRELADYYKELTESRTEI